jgi:hypothetical protein
LDVELNCSTAAHELLECTLGFGERIARPLVLLLQEFAHPAGVGAIVAFVDLQIDLGEGVRNHGGFMRVGRAHADLHNIGVSDGGKCQHAA